MEDAINDKLKISNKLSGCDILKTISKVNNDYVYDSYMRENSICFDNQGINGYVTDEEIDKLFKSLGL